MNHCLEPCGPSPLRLGHAALFIPLVEHSLRQPSSDHLGLKELDRLRFYEGMVGREQPWLSDGEKRPSPGPPVRVKVHSRSRGGAVARRGGRTALATGSGLACSSTHITLPVSRARPNRSPASIRHKTTMRETDSRRQNPPSMLSNPLMGT